MQKLLCKFSVQYVFKTKHDPDCSMIYWPIWERVRTKRAYFDSKGLYNKKLFMSLFGKTLPTLMCYNWHAGLIKVILAKVSKFNTKTL